MQAGTSTVSTKTLLSSYAFFDMVNRRGIAKISLLVGLIRLSHPTEFWKLELRAKCYKTRAFVSMKFTPHCYGEVFAPPILLSWSLAKNTFPFTSTGDSMSETMVVLLERTRKKLSSSTERIKSNVGGEATMNHHRPWRMITRIIQH
jgi:hypothetical protein